MGDFPTELKIMIRKHIQICKDIFATRILNIKNHFGTPALEKNWKAM